MVPGLSGGGFCFCVALSRGTPCHGGLVRESSRSAGRYLARRTDNGQIKKELPSLSNSIPIKDNVKDRAVDNVF